MIHDSDRRWEGTGWDDPVTAAVLAQIAALGYAVRTRVVDGVTELHAVPKNPTEQRRVARCVDGDGPEERYRTACLLATMVGIELDDG